MKIHRRVLTCSRSHVHGQNGYSISVIRNSCLAQDENLTWPGILFWVIWGNPLIRDLRTYQFQSTSSSSPLPGRISLCPQSMNMKEELCGENVSLTRGIWPLQDKDLSTAFWLWGTLIWTGKDSKMGLLQLAVTWYMLEGKLPTGTSKTKKIQIYLDEAALFWMSQWAACPPACTMWPLAAKGPFLINRGIFSSPYSPKPVECWQLLFW